MGSVKGLTSDLVIDASKFAKSSVTAETAKFNGILESISTKGPKWYEVGAGEYRLMWERGETPLPKPELLPEAKDSSLPSRDEGRDIPVRVYTPDNKESSKGVILHIHGGGFVLGSHKHTDKLLKLYANECQLTAVSVGYRLAPEDPYPAGAQDCIDAAEHLVDHAEELYGAPLAFIGGESAGATLTTLTAFQLMRSRPQHVLRGLVHRFGVFDLSLGLPKILSSFTPLVINLEAMQRFIGAYAPGLTSDELKNPSVSPVYDDLQGLAESSPTGKLPPALFICGTVDPLVDDTMLMSFKWMTTGSDAIVKYFPGGAHGFTGFPIGVGLEAQATTMQYVKEKLA